MSSKRERRKRERARQYRPTPRPSTHTLVGAAQEMADTLCEKARTAASDVLSSTAPSRERASQVACGTLHLGLQVIQTSPDAERHACKAGCAFCCHTAVTVSTPEAIGIVSSLQSQASPEDLVSIRDRIDANAELAGGMSRLEYIARSVRCALLTDDGNCRVHAVRPLTCAGFLSMSRSACEGEFRRVYGRPPVPVDRWAMLAGVSASRGMMQACQDHELDGDFYELHHALRRLWDMPDAADQWLAGESVLRGCLRADAW